MGAYLSEPKVECVSDDGENGQLRFGASAMQGWRLGMEDGHNCIPNLDDDTAMFAVYDGHGGAEVAIYCSKYLPEYIKSQDGYKEKEMGKSLEAAFMKIDAAIKEPAVVEELRHIAGLEEGSEEADAEETSALQEEANLPLGELLARYSYHPTKTRSLRKKLDKGDLLSPVVRKKPPSLPNGPEKNGEDDDDDDDNEPVAPMKLDEEKDEEEEEENKDCTGSKVDVRGNGAGDAGDNEEPLAKETINGKGTAPTEDIKCNGDAVTVSTKTNGRLEGDDTKEVDNEEEEEEEDGAEDDEADEEYEEEEEGSDSEEDEDEADDDEDDEEEEDEEEERLIDLQTQSDESTVPGSDSGCTAVVAVIRDNRVIVANAGDSRCVLSRAGQAVDLSIDHKPEDDIEITRIEKAGGKVTPDGRVNGGLNLSRAIGDHCYKCNTSLPAEEQMISALPDIQTAELTKENDFMVVACDGIWNVMTSQEVIDFVRERLNKQSSDPTPCKLSEICEELFHACLAPDTSGDGTGCDNMTCVIVQFCHDAAAQTPAVVGAKRKASESLSPAEPDDGKRPKT